MTNPVKGIASGHPPSKKSEEQSVHVGPLDTLSAVRSELGRLYRAARKTHGANPDAFVATKLAYILNAIGRHLEASEFERRLAELEKNLGNK